MAGPPTLPWWSEFHSFTFQHALTLGWTAPLMVVSCRLGRGWLDCGVGEGRHGQDARATKHGQDARATERVAAGVLKERRLCAGWAGFIVCVNLWSIFYWLQPEHYDIRQSLPLQMCDIGTLLAPLLFLTCWRPIRSIMYFWGIGLSSQAFITPTLLEGIGHPRYWIFWLGHLGIVGSAVCDLIVRGYRPMFRDFVLTTVVTTIWYAAVGILNGRIGSNYGYNGDAHPARPTLIDALGPYPARVFILGGMVIALFAALWAVWPLSARFFRTSKPSVD